MMNKNSQKEMAEQLRKLHHSGKMLILPNIWDVLGALLIQDLGYPAIATASASVALSRGYQDGENIPFNELLELLKSITQRVNRPVTADIESGYAVNDKQLVENIKLLIDAGIAGINIEDTDRESRKLHSIEAQSNKIGLIKQAAEEMGVPLFINARTDIYLHDKEFASGFEKFEEILKRGLAYKMAGADCFFPVLIREEEDIRKLVNQLDLPINIVAMPGIPDLNVLNSLGVARVSLGPSFLKIAIRAMKELALQLQNFNGLSTITGNEITSDYLKNLVSGKA